MNYHHLFFSGWYSFCGATVAPPPLNFLCHLPWIPKSEWIHSFTCFITSEILRFTSAATPTNLSTTDTAAVSLTVLLFQALVGLKLMPQCSADRRSNRLSQSGSANLLRNFNTLNTLISAEVSDISLHCYNIHLKNSWGVGNMVWHPLHGKNMLVPKDVEQGESSSS